MSGGIKKGEREMRRFKRRRSVRKERKKTTKWMKRRSGGHMN